MEDSVLIDAPRPAGTVAPRDMANAIRALAMDAVEAAQSGHPGMPMGMANVAATLYQVFLDAEATPEAIRVQFRRLLEVAHRRGSAVAIGHPHADTIAVLREEIPRAVAAGFEFVPVSSLASRAAGPELLR